MASPHRLSTTGALMVCLVGTQWSGTLFASEEEPSSSPAPSSQSVVNSASEAKGRTSASPAAAASVSEQPVSATELPRSTMERSRFTLSNEIITANEPLGAVSAKGWRSTLTFVPVESTFAQRGGYRGRGRGAEAEPQRQ